MDEPLEIPVDHPEIGHLPAIFREGARPRRRSSILLAHGSGAGMESPFLETVAGGLAAAGFAVLRFEYPYMARIRREGKRRFPDRAPVLEEAHGLALEALARRTPRRRILLAGKSLGGRIGSHLAAKGADCAGLVLLGYPLHPAAHPDRERTEHFGAIAQPALFLQGTRDALCELPRLRRALELWGGPVELETVEEGDHDFAVPKRTGRTREEVLAGLVGSVADWERERFPRG